jgi:hypothetical protein
MDRDTKNQSFAEKYGARPLTEEEQKELNDDRTLLEEELHKYAMEKKQKQWGLKLDEPKKETADDHRSYT